LPEFIKLDMFVTRDIDTDPAKQALASALVAFGGQIGAHLIAEGVETKAELDVVTDLGVECAQGYYLAKPAPLATPAPNGNGAVTRRLHRTRVRQAVQPSVRG